MGSEKKHVVAHMIDKTLIAESEEFAEAGWGTDAKCSKEVKAGSRGALPGVYGWLVFMVLKTMHKTTVKKWKGQWGHV